MWRRCAKACRVRWRARCSRVLARVAVDRHDTAALFLPALNEREASTATLTTPAQSLAILPFENLSADPDNQYFADGIADDILDALVQIDGLHVAARASAFSFRGKQDALAEIGRALNVATVLQGSLRRSGNRMRLAVQLISVRDGYHLWSERFDRELVDVFAVQDEISAAIAARLRVAFVGPALPAGKATLQKCRPSSWSQKDAPCCPCAVPVCWRRALVLNAPSNSTRGTPMPTPCWAKRCAAS